MIGVFDSGYGGLPILDCIRKKLPQYSYVYLGDNAHAPYGPKTDEEIFELTKNGVEQLFEKGCTLVILACNTSSASALRKLQQEWLSITYPDKKILGIIVPTAEAVSDNNYKTIGILATQHTVNTNVYEQEIHKRNPNSSIIQQPCNNLAGLIEQYGAHDQRVLDEVKTCVSSLVSPSHNLDAVLLGCTHYELIADTIQKLLPESTILIRQPEIVAVSLQNYLERHPEIEKNLQKNSQCTYLTTGDPQQVSAKSSSLMQEEVVFEKLK
ncbi:MAG TPA: glutamate racemase [Candidatus Andersenbacteria bacterium]|nr:glutamate racemase [Candidatus Andersenbacteria bacterium]